MQNRLFFTSYIITIIGVICLILEYLIYQYFNSDGVPQESFFTPLGFFLSYVGIIIWFVAMVIFIKNETTK